MRCGRPDLVLSTRRIPYIDAVRILCVVCALLFAIVSAADAQSFSLDARKIALGDIAGTGHIAESVIIDERPYGAFVLPLGILQLFGQLDRVNPDSDQFDGVTTLDYVLAPVHLVLGRTSDSSGPDFIGDMRRGRLNRDLNTYHGFLPGDQPSTGGLASPTYGGALTFARKDDGAFQRLYIGAGPYIALRGSVSSDPRLTRILDSSSPVYEPNAQLPLTGHGDFQAAASITFGYHARFLWPTAVNQARFRDGIYVAVHYNVLRGLRYEQVDSTLRFDTDSTGLLTLDPALPPPVIVSRDTSSSGTGGAIDAGIGIVVGRWAFGGGVNGIANHITWTDVQRTVYNQFNVLTGDGTFSNESAVSIPDVRMILPIDFRGNLAFHQERWSVLMAAGRGYQGGTFHVGYERRPSFGALRGGIFYTSGQWQPTGGLGINLSERLAVDLAVFGSSANIERERHLAVGASLRIGEPSPKPVRSR
jgi:hypothetical protein